MTNQPQKRIAKTLHLIKLLSVGKYTASELSGVTGLNVRSIYRYVNLLKDGGFGVQQNGDSKFFIKNIHCPFCTKVML